MNVCVYVFVQENHAESTLSSFKSNVSSCEYIYIYECMYTYMPENQNQVDENMSETARHKNACECVKMRFPCSITTIKELTRKK